MKIYRALRAVTLIGLCGLLIDLPTLVQVCSTSTITEGMVYYGSTLIQPVNKMASGKQADVLSCSIM